MYHSSHNVDNQGGYVCVGAGGIWKISVLSEQFCCEPKTTIKNSQLKKRRKELSCMMVPTEYNVYFID